MQAEGKKNHTSLHSIWDFVFRTRGSFSSGLEGHFAKGRRGGTLRRNFHFILDSGSKTLNKKCRYSSLLQLAINHISKSSQSQVEIPAYS